MTNFHTNYDKAPWTTTPIAELTTPKPGYICMGPRWWAVHKGGALFYKGSPQCNVNKSIIERIRPECDAVFVDMAFLPHRCSDYE